MTDFFEIIPKAADALSLSKPKPKARIVSTSSAKAGAGSKKKRVVSDDDDDVSMDVDDSLPIRAGGARPARAARVAPKKYSAQSSDQDTEAVSVFEISD